MSILGSLFGSGPKPERGSELPKVSPKEEKKDTSLFQGNKYMSGEKTRNWLRSEDAYKTMNMMPGEKRLDFGKELTDASGGVNRKGVEKILQSAEKFPNQYKSERNITEKERQQRIAAYKKILGK